MRLGYTGAIFESENGPNGGDEINVLQAGKNYGWRIMEGSHCTPKFGKTCDRKGLTPPVLDYGHEEGGSVDKDIEKGLKDIQDELDRER